MFIVELFSSVSAGIPGEEEADSVVEPPLDDLLQEQNWYFFISNLFTFKLKEIPK